MIERIRERRAALVAQHQQAVEQYNQIEATLRELDRQICGMWGGIQELDALLAAEAPTPERAATRRANGVHA